MSIALNRPFDDPLRKLVDKQVWNPTPVPSNQLPNGGMNITTQAPATGAFGWTYSAPYQGWNAWANYNTPQENAAFNYNMDPYYNAGADTQKWDLAQTGANSESNRARVWRWTLDNLRAQGYDPGKAPQDVVNREYFNSIARLRRDYSVNGFDWNRSGFSGYDKFATQQGGQTPGANMPGGPGATDPSGNPLPTMPPRQQTPTTGQPGGTAPPRPTNPGMGGTPGQNGGLSGASEAAIDADPKLAYQYMMHQLGMDPTVPSRFGDFLQKRFSPLLQAKLAASKVGDNAEYLGNLGQAITDFGQGLFQRGGDFFGDQRNIADAALGSQGTMDFLGGIKDQQQVEQYLNQLMTLKYAGANPMVQQSIADTLQRGQDQYDWEALMQMNNGQGAGDPYLEWLRRNPAYNRYLNVR